MKTRLSLLLVLIFVCTTAMAQTFVREGDSHYSNPIINIEGKLPTAILMVLLF